MFDRHIHQTHRVHETTTVHEHRAPTDESVRLLREMEKAASEKVLQSIRLENSLIDTVIHMQDDHLNAKRGFVVFIRINGKKIEVRHSFDHWDSQEKVVQGLLAAVSERIAAELLGPAFTQLEKNIGRLYG